MFKFSPAIRASYAPGGKIVAPAGPKSTAFIRADEQYGAHNYAPMPVVCSKAKGVNIWDPEGNKYFDFLAGYGSLNFGHGHPRIIGAAKKQLDRLTLCSRAFYNDQFGAFAHDLCKTMKYEKALLMNTGAEAVESAVKLARAWGYQSKGIPQDKALIVACTGNFHGRTPSPVAITDEKEQRHMFGPVIPGFKVVEYGNFDELRNIFEQHNKRMCAFLLEPIQGEAGVIIPPSGYLTEVRRLCTKYNVLMICDEVQSGMGRTGKLLAQEHEGVRADVTTLAKALGGGVVPVSAVLADDKFMKVFTPGTHGSTFGGNPLACAVGQEVLKVIKEENILQNANKVGKVMESGLKKMAKDFHVIKAVRNRGMWGAIEVRHDVLGGAGGKMLARNMMTEGILSKVTHDHTLRLSPPLTITEKEMNECLERMYRACQKTFTDAHKTAAEKHKP